MVCSRVATTYLPYPSDSAADGNRPGGATDTKVCHSQQKYQVGYFSTELARLHLPQTNHPAYTYCVMMCATGPSLDSSLAAPHNQPHPPATRASQPSSCLRKCLLLMASSVTLLSSCGSAHWSKGLTQAAPLSTAWFRGTTLSSPCVVAGSHHSQV